MFLSQGLPAIFCRKHLPNHDVKIVLEDEEGQTCDTNYLAYKMGLSGGWRGFVERHDLKVSDALVFHLVRPTIFKASISNARSEQYPFHGNICLWCINY